MNYFLRESLFILFLSINFHVFAQQNLVYNFSFEENYQCPEGIGNLNYSKGWFSPLFITTPDYYHRCSTAGSASIPLNWQGQEQPFDGNAYSGFYAYLDNTSEWMEYIGCKLVQQLDSGSCYKLSFYLSLSDSSCLAIENLGILFGKDSLFDSSMTYLYSNDVIELDTPISLSNGWKNVTINYCAKGGENYLYIGNFNTNSESVLTTINSNCANNFSYYYLDYIELYEFNNGLNPIPNVFTPNNDGINDFIDFTIYKGKEVYLINRWGDLVFKTSIQTNYFWFGQDSEGNDLTSGVYYFIVKSNKETLNTGSIHLLR